MGSPIRKIALVEPAAPGYHVYSRVRLPRLGLPQLAALLRAEGYDATVYCEDIQAYSPDELLAADLVGISTTTSTAPAAYALCDRLKRARPEIVTVLGGVHATFLPEEAAHHADYVALGEADLSFPDLVRRIDRGDPPLLPIVGRPLRTAPTEKISPSPICDLDALPFPDLSAIRGHERIRIAPLATSRGCPYDCAFCAVIEMFSRAVRYHSDTYVCEMLRYNRVRGFREAFFYDDNFIVDPQRTARLLERALSEGCAPRRWTAQVRAGSIVRDARHGGELLRIMKRSGCYMLYLGLESIEPETLRGYNKRQEVEEMVEALDLLRARGILAHGMFVFGADTDTPETIRRTVDFAVRHRISTIQFMILTPLPGTRTYRQLDAEGRIFDRDWSHYDAHHVVFQPARMTARELQRETMAAMAAFYAPPRILQAAVQEQRWPTAALRLYGNRQVARFRHNSREYEASLPIDRIVRGRERPR